MSKRRPQKQAKRKAEEEAEPSPPWYRRRRNQATLGGAVAAILAVVLLLLAMKAPLPFLPMLRPDEPPPYGLLREEGQPPLLFNVEWNDCTEDWRPDYGLECDEQLQLFGMLPKAPADLADQASKYYWNEISIEGLISKHPKTVAREYWEQPEWYAGWGQRAVEISRWPPKPNLTAVGINAYLDAKGVTIGQDSLDRGWVEMRSFLRVGWGIDTWQGFHLFPTYPDVALKNDGTPMCLDDVPECPPDRIIRQDPSQVPFRVSITNPSDSLYMDLIENGRWRYDAEGNRYHITYEEERRPGGQFFVMPNVHPRIQPSWARMLVLRIEFTLPSWQLPSGTFFFALQTDNPSWEVSEEYRLENSLYLNVGRTMATTAAPLFIGLVVIP